MIGQFLKKNRHVVWGLLSLVALLTLERWTDLSKWVLLVPVLLAMIALMTVFDRVFLRRGINNG
ncbi:hypothetical protein [Altererythrobacter sp. GH1-8]|uniref:hypothetical protein n=1 Tax=Altererythrobacter sp. GH1-8 TaxID=3349333 RepID=UPI00374CFBA3